MKPDKNAVTKGGGFSSEWKQARRMLFTLTIVIAVPWMGAMASEWLDYGRTVGHDLAWAILMVLYLIILLVRLPALKERLESERVLADKPYRRVESPLEAGYERLKQDWRQFLATKYQES